MAQAEFELIQRFFQRRSLAFDKPGLAAGIGDDCALLEAGAQQQLAVSMDLLQEGVHFPVNCDPERLGQRALRVNLSDLAAAGAEPLCFTLGLALPGPGTDADWLEAFADGLGRVASAEGCALAGGDISRGCLGVCIQVHGLLERGTMLRRDGARSGDAIFVTGTLGDAAAALPLVQGAADIGVTAAERQALLDAYYLPESRIRAGMALRGLATAAIDLSDGLAADLGHILRASGVGAHVRLAALPLSEAFRAAVVPARQAEMAIGGGDDYELCFTAPVADRGTVETAFNELGVPVTCIGEIVDDDCRLQWLNEHGQEIPLQVSGYQHFR